MTESERPAEVTSGWVSRPPRSTVGAPVVRERTGDGGKWEVGKRKRGRIGREKDWTDGWTEEGMEMDG